jgi:hypothetical protein
MVVHDLLLNCSGETRQFDDCSFVCIALLYFDCDLRNFHGNYEHSLAVCL